jgi:spore cortex biosynthesis protein YabQ
MGISIAQQTAVFLYSVLLGAMLSVFYDIFRALRKHIPHHNLVVMLEDILFWLISAAAVFVFIYNTNSGEVRAFVFIGAVLGGVLYFLTISKLVIRLLSAVFFALYKILFVLSRPIVLVSRPIRRAAGKSAKRSAKTFVNLKNLFKFKLKSVTMSLGGKRRKKQPSKK